MEESKPVIYQRLIMKKITDNYLLFTESKEFNQKTLDNFLQRLSLFLNEYLLVRPQLKIIHRLPVEPGRAMYDDENNTVNFVIKKYQLGSKHCTFDKEIIRGELLTDDVDDYQYAVPLSDIYHELIHAYQYEYTQYEDEPLLEAGADFITAVLTGQINIDYKVEITAIWYLARKVLKLKRPDQLYNFIRDTIIKDDWYTWFFNGDAWKEIIKKYDGDGKTKIGNFFSKYYKQLGNLKYYDDCIADIKRLHDLIYYRW